MTSPGRNTRYTLGAALLVPSMLTLWLFAVPGTLAMSTYLVLVSLMVATAAITLTTWRNSRAVDSLGQLLYATETAPVRAAVKTRSPNGINRSGS
jgi:hypothetical protein